MNATEQFLREQAKDALRRCGNVRKNNCDPVAGEFAYVLEDDFGHTAYAPVKAYFQGRKHFVALVPVEEVTFCKEGDYVVVDPTVKQFEDTVGGELPEIAVLPPSDDRRERWYDSITDPE